MLSQVLERCFYTMKNRLMKLKIRLKKKKISRCPTHSKKLMKGLTFGNLYKCVITGIFQEQLLLQVWPSLAQVLELGFQV